MPSFEYVGVRAIIAGINDFKRDASTYNTTVDSMVKAVQAQADRTVAAAKAQQAAWDKAAANAVDASRATIGAADAVNKKYGESIAALQAKIAASQEDLRITQETEAKKTAAVVEGQAAIIKSYEQAAAAAIASAEADVKAAESAARAARARLGAAGGRGNAPTGAAGTLGQVTGFSASADLVAQTDLANAKLAETKAILAEVQQEQIAYGATVLNVTAGVVASRSEEEAQLVAARQATVAADREAIAVETQLAAAEQYVADNAAQEAIAAEAAAAKTAQLGAILTGAAAGGAKEIDLLTQSIKNAVTTTVDFGKDLLIVSGILAAAFGVAVVAGIKNFTDLETAVASVQAVTDASTTQAEALGKTYLMLGRNVGVSIDNISKIGQELGRSGFSVDQLNSGLVKQVTLLSQASGGELDYANAANFVGAAVHQFGIDVNNVGQIIDATAAVAAKTTLTFTDITNGFKQAAATGKEFGLSWQQILAIVAETGQVLGSGTQAGTNLNQMLTRLKAPTAAAAKGLNDIGVAVYDGAGRIRDFRDILKDLAGEYENNTSKLNKLTESQREHVLTEIFNTRSAREVYVLLQQGTKAYDDMSAAIDTSTGFAQRAADVMNNTLSAQLQILKNNLSANSIELVQTFVPGLKDFIKTINTGLASDNVIKSVQTLGLAVSGLARGGDLTQVIANIRALTGGSGTGFEQLVLGLQNIGDGFAKIGVQAQGFLAAIDKLNGGAGTSAEAIKSAADAVVGFEGAVASTINRASQFVDRLRDMGVTGDTVRQVIDDIVKIGLVGMGAALAGLVAPLALTAAKVAALALVLTELHQLYTQHPVLAAAATAALAALALAYTAVNLQSSAAGQAIGLSVGTITKLPPQALLAAGALAGLALTLKAVNDASKEGNQFQVEAAQQDLARAKSSQELASTLDQSFSMNQRALEKANESVDAAQKKLDDLQAKTGQTKGFLDDAWDGVRKKVEETSNSWISNMSSMGGAIVGLAATSIKAGDDIQFALDKAAIAAANLRAATLADANAAEQGMLNLSNYGGVLQENDNALKRYTASQQASNRVSGTGSEANYNLGNSAKKATDETKNLTTEVDREADVYRNAVKTLDQLTEQERAQQQQIVDAHDQATTRIADDYKKQTDAATRAATDQRTEAQRAYSEQRGDMVAAFAQQEADRQQAYATQLSDMQAAFAQQKADLLAQAGFEKTLADEQDAFNQAQAAKSTALNQQLQTAKVNDDYNDKVAALDAKTNDRMAQAKTASQKKALQVSYQLQKDALGVTHQQALDDLTQQFADQKRQADLDQTLAADQNAFQKKQAEERAVNEEAIRQQTFDRQVLAAQQAYDRQEQAALQSLQRQEKAQDQALARQLSRIDDQQKRADDSAAEQRDTAVKEETKRLADVQAKQDKANDAAKAKFTADLNDRFEELKAQNARDTAEAGKAAEAVYKDAVQVAQAARQAAVQKAAAFNLPLPPPLTFSPFVPAVYHTGRVGLGLGEELARVQATETIMTPTQVSNLVSNAVSVGARNVNSNNSQTFNMSPSYSNLQTPGSLMLDLQAMLASARS